MDLTNWRSICRQRTNYNIYVAVIAKRIVLWALEMKAINIAQKGFPGNVKPPPHLPWYVEEWSGCPSGQV